MIDILCNERCTKCHHWMHSSQKEINDIGKIIDFINDINTIDEFVIVGGEPLIYRDDILRIINSIDNHKVRVIIITNGVLATEEFIKSIQGKNVHIVFSIDTLDEKEWIFVRGNNTMNTVLSNFLYAHNILDPTQLSAQSVLAKETAESVKSVGHWLSTLGIYHSIQHYVQDGFDGEWNQIENSNLISAQMTKCFAHELNMSILPNGDVVTCFQQNLIKGCQQPLGNINRDSARVILTSPYLQIVRKLMEECNLPCKVLKCNTEVKQ
jgi:MoaA/NifB/PqqE/SkfB family radical SAM enzyme